MVLVGSKPVLTSRWTCSSSRSQGPNDHNLSRFRIKQTQALGGLGRLDPK